jgi:hypothetical protein
MARLVCTAVAPTALCSKSAEDPNGTQRKGGCDEGRSVGCGGPRQWGR